MATYTLNFTEPQMMLLNQAICELPHKYAAPLIQSINEQIVAAAKTEEDRKKSAEGGTGHDGQAGGEQHGE